jgi:hypothetical protein
MGRGVKHVQLHRIGSTELRVVSDIDEGVSPIVQVEELVIRRYAQQGDWPHRRVELFVLQDLSPLSRQLGAQVAALPGGVKALESRPVLHIYDLGRLTRCTVFVNQQAMLRSGYWTDMLAVQGLLAHEHAHPLAENSATRASRCLRTQLMLAGDPSDAQVQRHARLEPLLGALLERLVISAPREIFTNELTITSGFDQALLHLNRRNVADAGHSLAGRAQLRFVLEQDVAAGNRPASDIGQLLLGGDLENQLVLAMEIAPFIRAGRLAEAQELQQVLDREIFPQIESQVAPAFAAIMQLYTTLSPDAGSEELVGWGRQVAGVLATALAEQGLSVQVDVTLADTDDD